MADRPEGLTLAEAEAILSEGAAMGRMPQTFLSGRRPRTPEYELITDWGPLGPEHIAAAQAHIESGASLGLYQSPIKALRHTHHRLAQYLAMGMDETKAAKLCNYSVGRVSILKSDPAFAELLAYYSAGVEEEFADFVSTAADLSMDMLGRLRELLEDEPDRLSPGQVMEAIKLLADRSGNAPVQKSQNVNVNIDMGSRLRAARERAQALDTAGLIEN
jgi:hypothetical protein